MLKYTEPIEQIFDDCVVVDGYKFDFCDEVSECCIARVNEKDSDWVLYQVTDCHNGNISIVHGEEKHYISVNWFVRRGALRFVFGPDSIARREVRCRDYAFAKPLLDHLMERNCVLDLARWWTYSDAFKVLLLCYVAAYRISLVNEQRDQFDQICSYEGDRPLKLVFALLQFFLAYRSVDPQEKIQWARKAHETLILELTKAKREGRDISAALFMLFPPCPHGNCENLYCDAYYENKMVDGKAKISFTCSHHADFVYSPSCANPEKDDPFDQYADFRDRHFQAVQSGVERPDFRDLIHHCQFKIAWMVSPGAELYFDDLGYVFRISAYVNRLDQILPYLKCWHCDRVMDPDFDYSHTSTVYTLTHFKCIRSDEGAGHAKGVYINHCYQCRSMTGRRYIIDQRECAKKAFQLYKDLRDSSFVCMRCGGSINFDPRKNIGILVCPKCGVPKAPKRFANGVIECLRPECRHNGAEYGEKPKRPDHPWSVREELPI